MEVIEKVSKMCLLCMEEHEVSIVRVNEKTIFKGIEVEYDAVYEYCDKCQEFSSTEDMISKNDIAVKAAYRSTVGLLTPSDIKLIRSKYGISQSDLSIVLGWGGKTITRYETHQVQTAAHDSILRKIDLDPEWFLQLLNQAKDKFSNDTYRKYLAIASELFSSSRDSYLRKWIESQYVKYEQFDDHCGGTILDLDKVVGMIRYLANSAEVLNLYKVKFMKMLWYADALSYKRYGRSMTGLVYKALKIGAVPIAHESLIELEGVVYEERDFDNGVAYEFIPTSNLNYDSLSNQDFAILDHIIASFGKVSTNEIVTRMHEEDAYKKTSFGSIISYVHAKSLSLS